MIKITAILYLTLFSMVTLAQSPATANAKLYFISPTDGTTVTNPVTVRFGLSNMGVAPAGVQIDNTGHHHLLVDTAVPPLDKPVPNDTHHLHFGKGQTETTLELTPGKHTLQLLLGDYVHTPHKPPVISDPITITVE